MASPSARSRRRPYLIGAASLAAIVGLWALLSSRLNRTDSTAHATHTTTSAATSVADGAGRSDPGPAAILPGAVPPTRADIGFARDMSVHHAQAVDLAERIRSRTADAALRLLATDIVLTQQQQIGRFRGWLDEWGEAPTSLDPPMAWAGDMAGMHHAGDASTTGTAGGSSAGTDTAMGAMPGMAHDTTADDTTNSDTTTGGTNAGSNASATPTNLPARMPGMAAPGDVSKVSSLPVADAEVQFLRVMIAHHRGGVDMANAVLTLTRREEVRSLARSIVAGQQSEIDLMTGMLRTRGATVG